MLHLFQLTVPKNTEANVKCPKLLNVVIYTLYVPWQTILVKLVWNKYWTTKKCKGHSHIILSISVQCELFLSNITGIYCSEGLKEN